MRNAAHKKAGTVTAILMIFGLLAVTAILPVNATESYIRGDSNGDGVVSIGDVTAIQRHLAELEHLNSDRIKAADVTGEGLDISDATAIQMYLAEYENTFKIGETVIYDEYELPFIPNN